MVLLTTPRHKKFFAQRRKDAKFFRIGKSWTFWQNGILVVAMFLTTIHESKVTGHRPSGMIQNGGFSFSFSSFSFR
jgi:hypothetical protein